MRSVSYEENYMADKLSHEEVFRRCFRDGYLFNISIEKRSWSMTLKPSDLGMEKFPENWTAGRRLMLPASELGKIDFIEGAARRHLIRKSMLCEALTGKHLRFIQKSMCAEVLADLEKYRIEFFDAIKSCQDRYEELKAHMRDKFPEQWPAFVDKYPPQSEFCKGYTFEFSHIAMAYPNIEGVNAAKMIQEGKLDEERQRLALQANARMQADIANAGKKFLDDTCVMIRTKVLETFNHLITKREAKGQFTKTNIDAVTEVLDYVKEMDFLGDARFNEQLRHVQQVLSVSDDIKSSDDALAALDVAMRGVVSYVEKSPGDVAEVTDRYIRNIAI